MYFCTNRVGTLTLHWFETELLTHEENLVGLRAVNRELLAQAEMATRADRIVLDMDSSESPVLFLCPGGIYLVSPLPTRI